MLKNGQNLENRAIWRFFRKFWKIRFFKILTCSTLRIINSNSFLSVLGYFKPLIHPENTFKMIKIRSEIRSWFEPKIRENWLFDIFVWCKYQFKSFFCYFHTVFGWLRCAIPPKNVKIVIFWKVSTLGPVHFRALGSIDFLFFHL